jgi:hypothetical protein
MHLNVYDVFYSLNVDVRRCEYTTTSAHHLQLVQTSIPHRLHTTYTQDYNSPHKYIKHHSVQIKRFQIPSFNNCQFLTYTHTTL